MAKINNQAVMQKLIDELKLYPAKDVIPTELADKILAVYQVNSQDVNVNIKPNYYLWQDVTVDDFDKTLTVPDGHTYVIKAGMLRYHCDATVAGRIPTLEIHDAAGNLIWGQEYTGMTASQDRYHKFNIGGGSIQAVADTGENYIPASCVPFPENFVMLENWTLRWSSRNEGGQAGDDLEISMIVEDIKD